MWVGGGRGCKSLRVISHEVNLTYRYSALSSSACVLIIAHHCSSLIMHRTYGGCVRFVLLSCASLMSSFHELLDVTNSSMHDV